MKFTRMPKNRSPFVALYLISTRTWTSPGVDTTFAVPLLAARSSSSSLISSYCDSEIVFPLFGALVVVIVTVEGVLIWPLPFSFSIEVSGSPFLPGKTARLSFSIEGESRFRLLDEEDEGESSPGAAASSVLANPRNNSSNFSRSSAKSRHVWPFSFSHRGSAPDFRRIFAT